ncbi:protein takeout [Cephus cinctus]|uniref:Protein takeout n=1 Tax=Cephus cinctus TaxID=211228 RepID=A0AAJ7CA24_CEPCN|nr:protein takeout [Cephus cinctus]
MFLATVAICIVLLGNFAIAEVPSYIHICGRKDPQLNDCIIKSVEALRGNLRNGIPELDVPPVEPMKFKKIALSDTPNFRAIAQDVKLYGLSDFTVTSLKTDLNNKRIDLNVIFKDIKLNAEYDVSARIVVPIAGTGPIEIVADGVAAKVTLKFQLVNHKGKTYMYFPSITIKLTIKDYISHFVPREGENSPLANGINAALSNGRQEIIETITPNLEKVISEQILEYANKICKHFTYEELFPDRE